MTCGKYAEGKASLKMTAKQKIAMSMVMKTYFTQGRSTPLPITA